MAATFTTAAVVDEMDSLRERFCDPVGLAFLPVSPIEMVRLVDAVRALAIEVQHLQDEAT